MLRTVADEFYRVHDGRVEPFGGDLEDYARRMEAAASGGEDTAAPSGQNARARKARRREQAERRNQLGPLKARVEHCERELERLATARAAVEQQLAAPELYSEASRERLQTLLAEQRRLCAALAQTEVAWLEAAERLERA